MSSVVDIVTMSLPRACRMTAQVGRKTCSKHYIGNVWGENFSKVIAFFIVESKSDLVEHGSVGGNVSMSIRFNMSGNTI